jgi:hypothetical protein
MVYTSSWKTLIQTRQQDQIILHRESLRNDNPLWNPCWSGYMMFCVFAWDTGKRYWPVIYRIIFLSFLVHWADVIGRPISDIILK